MLSSSALLLLVQNEVLVVLSSAPHGSVQLSLKGIILFVS